MTKEQINKILREGSVKEKINLYFTSMALFNITFKDVLITEEEREQIENEVTDKKDKKYFSDLNKYTLTFLLWKPYFNYFSQSFKYYNSYLMTFTESKTLNKQYEEVINKLLSLYEDKQKAEAINILLKYLKDLNPIVDKHKIKIKDTDMEPGLISIVDKINKESREAKEMFLLAKNYLKRRLPLKPYKDFIDTEEKEIIKAINKSIEVIKFYNEVTGYDNKIISWKDIEIELKKEDIEHFENAG